MCGSSPLTFAASLDQPPDQHIHCEFIGLLCSVKQFFQTVYMMIKLLSWTCGSRSALLESLLVFIYVCFIYTLGGQIYAEGYIAFALRFVRSYVRSFVCSFVTFRHVRTLYLRAFG